MNITTETKNLTPFLRISDPEEHITFGYYSNNSWVDDHRLVLARFRAEDPARWDSHNGYGDLTLVDIRDGSEQELVETGVFSYVVHGTTLYYLKPRTTLWAMDLTTGAVREICRGENMDLPHMTRDGRYLCWNGFREGHIGSGWRVDLVTGEVVRIFEKPFAEPFPEANHVMISPTDPDLLFFSHEGDTHYVSNRLWLARLGEQPRNIAKQRLNEDGDLGDCFGHECWAPDGKGLWFVKYPCSPTPPRGVCYVDIETGESEVRYTGFPYWHASASPDGRFVAADTQGAPTSSVVLIDLAKGTETELVQAHINWVHPCHPHPMFSLDCTKLCFHELDEKGKVTVGILDISQL